VYQQKEIEPNFRIFFYPSVRTTHPANLINGSSDTTV